MELKKIIIFCIFIFYFGQLNAELIKPSKKFDPYDVVKIQLIGLKNNDEKDQGIKQTWLYGQQYKYLINHSSHKIKLITNSPNVYVYRIEILTDDKKLFFYEWHVKKGSDDNCKNCWYTSAVSLPVDQGNTI